MKKVALICFIVLFSSFSCKESGKYSTTVKLKNIDNEKNQVNIDDFIGYWEVEETTNNDTFSIHLFKNKEGVLDGYYCSVVRNGNKIDCSPDEEINIRSLSLNKEELIVSFSSFFGAKNGEAKISLIDNKIHWQIIKKPIGEYYCPLDSFLSKRKRQENNTVKQITKETYKSSDITMQLYKDIIEYYGCGDYSVSGMSLGKVKDYEIFIVQNDCGDFPYKDLISINKGKIVDKLTIESYYFDIEKSENQNIQDIHDVSFDIENLSKININKKHTINDKVISDRRYIFRLKDDGKFSE